MTNSLADQSKSKFENAKDMFIQGLEQNWSRSLTEEFIVQYCEVSQDRAVSLYNQVIAQAAQLSRKV